MDGIEHLRKFQGELKKLRFVHLPNELQLLVSQSLAIRISKSFELPVTSAQSPFVQIFSRLAPSQSQQKMIAPFVPVMVDVISMRCFGGDSLRVLLHSFVLLVNYFEPDLAIKLLQTNANQLIDNLDYCEVILGIFSVTLMLTGHNSAIVSTTAFATTEQMISVLFESVHSRGNSQVCVVEEREFVGTQIAASWLLLRDFFLMAQKSPPKALKCGIPNCLSEIIELLLKTHHKFLIAETILLEIIPTIFNSPLTESNVDLVFVVLRDYGHSCIPQVQLFFARLLRMNIFA
jgi:hypothetical protein